MSSESETLDQESPEDSLEKENLKKATEVSFPEEKIRAHFIFKLNFATKILGVPFETNSFRRKERQFKGLESRLSFFNPSFKTNEERNNLLFYRYLPTKQIKEEADEFFFLAFF